MSTPLQVHHSSPIAADVFEGLTSKPKWLSPKLFYDASGSALFEQITELPEYYLTRTERSILLENASEIIEAAGSNLSLIELGAGTASKTRILIGAALEKQKKLSFFPIDVSRSALDEAVVNLNGDFRGLQVSPVVADYSHGLGQLAKLPGRKLLLYLGSSIGNFEPMQAGRMLHMMRATLKPGDALLLGTDMVKSPEILLPAYDDALGVTAEFNRNILRHINRELDADFNPSTFKHVALFNPAFSRMEMHLESTRPQVINIRSLQIRVNFAKGERIHTENSYKFTQPVVDSILNLAGLAREKTWTDAQNWFALHLARVQ
jgi:L-histidine N-alpha-methyltransferase